ncbi:hypothetical protein QUF61_10155 [Candidatus Venteria ishoeyi]|uniref:hypothetical protein n=1 Tax=Candidatus Venteria ishoeyi TaxID=1899563 RepID=UPI0025A639D2|nr:hypothetical protein [Candidatus Venteria ishoeyi]MDM8546844.1 hypothetical protein [Candidatus Venteria ishoeyi]
MPFSQSSQLSSIVGFLEQFQPKSLLDVGIGMGQYGFLARTNLEHLHLFDIDGAQVQQRPREDWDVRIDGIKAFATYRTPVHDYVYNQIHWGNALDILPGLADKQYELVMAIDILEHFTTQEGLLFLEQLKRLASRGVLISTPKNFIHQEVEANPYENHRSLWTQTQLAEQGFSQILNNEESWIAIHPLDNA